MSWNADASEIIRSFLYCGGQLNPRKEIYASRNRLRAHKHHQTEVVSSQSSPQ